MSVATPLAYTGSTASCWGDTRVKHGWSITIGRLGGTVVRIHLTFVLLLLWIGIVGWRGGGMASAWLDIVFIVLLFACVLLHEFGHVLAARAFGIATRDIVLYPIGGLARIQSSFDNPRQELVIAIAGPAVSFALAALLAVLAGGPPAAATLGATLDWRTMAGLLAAANLALAVFNLLPAFPMDGGRIFRALMAWWLGRSTGTRIAAWIGRLAGVLFIGYGLVEGQLFLALIGVFVLFSASAEAAAVDLEDTVSGAPAGAVMVTEVATLPDTATLGEAAAALLRTEQHLFPVLDPAARPVGLLTRNAILAAGGYDKGTPLARLSDRAPAIIAAADPADASLPLLEEGAPAVLVVTADGRFAGLITMDNLAELRVLAKRPRQRRNGYRLTPEGTSR